MQARHRHQLTLGQPDGNSDTIMDILKWNGSGDARPDVRSTLAKNAGDCRM